MPAVTLLSLVQWRGRRELRWPPPWPVLAAWACWEILLLQRRPGRRGAPPLVEWSAESAIAYRLPVGLVLPSHYLEHLCVPCFASALGCRVRCSEYKKAQELLGANADTAHSALGVSFVNFFNPGGDESVTSALALRPAAVWL